MDWQSFFTPTVIWFLAGLCLLLLELALPGLIIIFFGVGAWITSLCLLIFGNDIGVNIQLLIFLLSSVMMLVLLRRHLKKKFFDTGNDNDETLEDEFIGKTAFALTSFGPNKPGKIEFKGANWGAISEEEINEGETVKIIDKESIKLKVIKLK